MTSTMEPTWRARVDDRDGPVRGAGVVVDDRHVLTCAHVIASSVDEAGTGTVLVRFPEMEPARSAIATVAKDGWFPQADLAVLALPEPAGVSRPVLRPCGPAGGRTVSVFGYPGGRPDGAWARGRLVGATGPNGELRQVAGLSSPGSRIETGFSGAGVVDAASDAVIGLIVASDPTANALVMPLESIARYWPPLLGLMSDGPGPAQPEEKRPSGEALRELVDALLEIPGMTDPTSRRDLLYLLPRHISAAIPRNASPRAEALNIVRTCLQYPGGLADLLNAIQRLEGDSPQTHALAQRVAELQ